MRAIMITMAGMMLAGILTAMAAEETVQYFYDEAGRLIGAGFSSGGENAAIQYKYDANGNMTRRAVYGKGDPTNSDGDDLNDVDELAFFGHLNEDGGGDPDGDTLLTRDEIPLGGNPAQRDTDRDGMEDDDEAVAGTRLDDDEDIFEVAHVELTPAGQVRVWWNVVTDRRYQLQMRPNLETGDWGDIGPSFDATAPGPVSSDEFFDPSGFFRVRVRVIP